MQKCKNNISKHAFCTHVETNFDLETFLAVIWQLSVLPAVAKRLEIQYTVAFHLYWASFNCLNREDRNEVLKSLFSGMSQTAETPQTGSFCLLRLSRAILRRQERRYSSFAAWTLETGPTGSAALSLHLISALTHKQKNVWELHQSDSPLRMF